MAVSEFRAYHQASHYVGAAPPPPADPPVVQPAQNDQQSKPGSKENKAAVDPNYAKLARTDLRVRGLCIVAYVYLHLDDR